MNKIASAFNDVAINYDRQRESLIPCYNEFYRTAVNLAESSLKQPKILDIGAGTGLLSNFMMQKFPDATYTLIDFSEDMLNVARKRFGNNKNFTYTTADYLNYNYLGKFDIVASSLSIHHLENNEKKKLYALVYKILEMNGIFINADQFLARSANVEKHLHEQWIEAIEKSSLLEEEKQSAYSRMKFDKPATIENNLLWLEEAGFKLVDLYYKYSNFGVITGRKINNS